MKMKMKENLFRWFWRLTMNSGCVELSAAATLSVFLGLVCFAFMELLLSFVDLVYVSSGEKLILTELILVKIDLKIK
jgi:hypothetical protein